MLKTVIQVFFFFKFVEKKKKKAFIYDPFFEPLVDVKSNLSASEEHLKKGLHFLTIMIIIILKNNWLNSSRKNKSYQNYDCFGWRSLLALAKA